jgi:hypothetical protein
MDYCGIDLASKANSICVMDAWAEVYRGLVSFCYGLLAVGSNPL